MLGKFKICPVDHSFAFRYTRYSGFKVVRPEYSRYSAKIFVRVDMGGGPTFLILGHKSLDICITAVRQYCHKDIRLDGRAGVGIRYANILTGPVDLHYLSRLVIQMHGCVVFNDIVTVIFVELCGLIWNFACFPALAAVFSPEQAQGHAVFAHFLVYLPVIRHFVARFLQPRREKPVCYLLVA